MNTLIKVDLNAKPEEQDIMHNRWHPDIPMVAMVNPGDEFRVECVDWTGGQVANTNDASDIKYVCLLYTSPSPRDPSISRMPSSA